jgi:hypothetical protein
MVYNLINSIKQDEFNSLVVVNAPTPALNIFT